MYHYQTVLNRINELENKLQAIVKNTDLNNLGLGKAKKAWEIEKAAAGEEALVYLRSDIATLRRDFAANEARRETAAAHAAAYWDFARMQYEVTAISAMLPNITNTASLAVRGWDPATEFSKQYAAVVQGQDKHKRRAWCEVGIPYFQAHFQGDHRAVLLVETLTRDLAELMTTPELDLVSAEGAKLANLALVVVDAVKTARRYYVDSYMMLLGPTDPFTDLLEGITIERGEYDGEKDRFEITVTVDTTRNTSAG